MNRSNRVIVAVIMGLGAFCGSSTAVLAYGGPGSVVTGIGALFAAVAALLAALFGFVWFPLKKLIGTFKSDPPNAPDETPKAEES